MIKLIPATSDEPFFLVQEGTHHYPITAGQIRRLLKKWCQKIVNDPDMMVNPQSYTPHCLRRGGLNWAHKAKLTGETLKVLGDWSSEVYHKYLDVDFDVRLESSKQMVRMMQE